jgi:glycosyltransferase involved in cell wall biosynthesis
MRIVLTEPETQARLGRNAAALAQQYSWRQIADQLLAAFDQVLENRRKRSPVSHKVS